MNITSGSGLEREVVQALPRVFLNSTNLRLRPTAGVKGAPNGPDAVFELEIDQRRIPVHVEARGRYSPAAEDRLRKWSAQLPEGIALLALPKIPRAVRARLRAEGMSHADLTGTVYLRAPGIRVDVAGTARPQRLTAKQRVNPFSKRASLVPRALLANSAAVVGVTALAEHLGLAKGWVSQVLAEMSVRGWVEGATRGARLTDPVGLLRAWSLEYTWRDNAGAEFSLPFEHDELLERLPVALNGLRWGLTLQSGAARLVPHSRYRGQLHVYVDPADQDIAAERLQEEMHAVRTPSSGILQVLRPYYGAGTFYDLREKDGLQVVSPVQLYLDLVHFPVRGAETARALARGVLTTELALGKEDVRRLAGDTA